MELIYILIMLSFFLVPFVLAKLWYWVLFVSIAIITLGIVELIAVLRTKKTISQQFVEYMKKNKGKAILIVLSTCVGYGMLILHLLLEIP
jgi:hypothetical protein